MTLKTKICPTCGFPQPDDDVAALLPRRKREIYEAVQRAGQAGISAPEIFNEVWGSDPRGRPQGMGAIYAHIVGINKVIEVASMSILHGYPTAGRYTLRRFGKDAT